MLARQLVADVISTMQVRANAKGLSLSVEYGSDIPPEIATDPVRLRQILVNLVGNAIKFTERGSIRVVVERDAEAVALPSIVLHLLAQIVALREALPIQPHQGVPNFPTDIFDVAHQPVERSGMTKCEHPGPRFADPQEFPAGFGGGYVAIPGLAHKTCVRSSAAHCPAFQTAC